MRKSVSTIFVLALIILNMSNASAEEEAPTGINCDLSVPPELAGEETNRGQIFKIYPRNKHITQEYSGCQKLWAPKEGGWVLVSSSEIVNGYPVRVWSPHGSQEWLACRYFEGKLVTGNVQQCPSPMFLLVMSKAPGCLSGSKSERPPESECKYE